MSTLRQFHKQKLNEAYLYEMCDGREDIMEFAQELSNILEEYNEEVLGFEDGYLVEQRNVTKLSSGQLKKLFRASVAISQGKEPKEGLLSKVTGKAKAAKELARKMTEAIKKGAKKLQDTEPVQGFDMKVADTLGKWKEKLGDDHKAVKLAQQMGEFGKKHPKKTAFIIGALTALTSAVGSPAFGAAAGLAMRTAMGLAKGERASAAIGKAALTGAIGASVGMAGKEVAEFFGLGAGGAETAQAAKVVADNPDAAAEAAKGVTPAEAVPEVEPEEVNPFREWRQKWFTDLQKGDFENSEIGRVLKTKIQAGIDPTTVMSNLENIATEVYGEDPRGGRVARRAGDKLALLIQGAMMNDQGMSSITGSVADRAEVMLKAVGLNPEDYQESLGATRKAFGGAQKAMGGLSGPVTAPDDF